MAVLPGLLYLITLLAIVFILIFQGVMIYNTYRNLNATNISSSDIRDLSQSFHDLDKRFNELKASYDRLTYLMTPFMNLSPLAQEVGGLDGFFTDVEDLIRWSNEALMIAEDMAFLQSDIKNVLDSDIALSSNLSTYITRLEDSKIRLETLRKSMNRVREPPTFGLVVNLFGLNAQVSQIKDILDDNVNVALSSNKVILNVFDLVTDGESLFEELNSDTTRSENGWHFDEIEKDVDYIQFRAMKTLGILHELGRYDENINPVSLYMDELGALLSLTITLCDSIKLGLEIVKPLKETGTSGKFLQDGSLVTIVNELNQKRSDLRLLRSNINRLEIELNRLAEFDIFINREDISRISEIVPDVKLAIDFGIETSKHGGEFIGIGGQKKYLVLGHSSDEIRGTGGFVSAIWLMVWENGRLSDLEYYDTVEVDDIDRITLYPEAPEDLRKHMNAWAWLMRDISWDPDFPTTAKNAIYVFNLGQGVTVDGVIGINQWSLNKLVDAVGEITVEGNYKPISSRNLISLLEEGTDEQGRQFTDKIMNAFINELQSSKQLSKLLGIGTGFRDSLDSKDILINHNSSDIQKMIEKFGWSGSVNRSQNDFIYIVDSNVGWTKSDRNVERSMRYEVDLSGKTITSNLRVYYYNHSAPSAAPCEPQWINRGKSYFELKNACYWDYMRIYVPDSAQMIYGTPMPLPKMSVAVETGYEKSGSDTLSTYKEHGRSVFSGIFTLEHSHDKSLEFVYDLPHSLIESSGGLKRYSLFVQKQPGVQRRVSNFTIKLPNISTIISVDPEPDSQSDGVIVFSDFLERDFELTVEYRD